ncbi:MAG: GumC family protein [Actinomycetota bacterium]
MNVGDVVASGGAFVRKYWRLPAIAVLAAMVAYSASFVIGPTYEASTRLLIRGRDATFLTTTGESLSNQPGVVDSTLAKALGETLSALISTRRVAELVVDDLNLDAPRPPETSPLKMVRSAFKTVYAHVRAWIQYGFYAKPSARRAAVEEVYLGLEAEPIKESYVIELTGKASEPGRAAAIADSGAEALVKVGAQRFRDDAQAYRDFLRDQAERAGQEQAQATEALRQYRESHGITDLSLEVLLDTGSVEKIREELRDADVSLSAARAELTALENSLARTSATDASVSQIQTGRGTTEIKNTAGSSGYQQLKASRDSKRGEVAALEAKREALKRAIDSTAAPALTQEEAELRRLELRFSIASKQLEDLSTKYQQAVVNSEHPRVEVTRIDKATAPTYPSAPQRHIYLLLGGLVGAIAGFLVMWRRGELAFLAVSEPPPASGPALRQRRAGPVVTPEPAALLAGGGSAGAAVVRAGLNGRSKGATEWEEGPGPAEVPEFLPVPPPLDLLPALEREPVLAGISSLLDSLPDLSLEGWPESPSRDIVGRFEVYTRPSPGAPAPSSDST